MLDQSVLTVLSSRVKLKRKHLPGDRKQQLYVKCGHIFDKTVAEVLLLCHADCTKCRPSSVIGT